MFALGGTLAWFVLCALLFGIRYEVNDDAIISNIASGAYGPATQYLVYPNILLGYLLKPLYWLASTLNWFVITLLAPGLACFAWLGTLLLRRLGGFYGGVAFAALLVLAGTECFTRFHYVRWAAVYLATGLLLLALHLGQWDFGTLTGEALVLLGSLLRFQQLAATGGVALALLLVRFVSLDGPRRKRALLCAAATAALVLLCFGVDTLAYRADDGWRAYTEYNAARTEVSDHKLYFVDGPEAAEALGLTATEYDLLQSWTFYDTHRFSTGRLQELAATLPGNRPAAALRSALAAGARALYERPVNLLFAAAGLLWLFYGKKSRHGWAAWLGTLCGYGVMLLYLAWRGRILERIDYGLAFAALLFTTACFLLPGFAVAGASLPAPPGTKAHAKTNMRKTGRSDPGAPQGGPPGPVTQGGPLPKVAALLAALLLVAALPTLAATRTAMQDYWPSRAARQADVDALLAEGDGATLYLLDNDLVDAANGFNVWRARPAGYFENTVFVGSWLMQSPFEAATLEKWGLENPYPDAVDRPDVLVADYYHRALKEDHLHESYGIEATLELVREWGSFNLYRATTEKAPEEG